MSRQKFFPLLFLIIIIISLSIVPIKADTSITASYNTGGSFNGGVAIKDNYPDTAYISAGGQTFNPTVTGYLSGISVTMLKSGAPTGYLICYLTGTTGVYGTNSVSDGNILARSETLLSSSLTTSSADYTFLFNRTYQLIANTKYAFIVVWNGTGTIDNTNYFLTKGTATGASYGGENFYYDATGWHAQATHDLQFTVYVSDTSSITATPTPTATPVNQQHAIWNGTHWVNYNQVQEVTLDLTEIMVPLLVVVIAGLLGAWKGGLIGFLAGINVSVIILYVVTPEYMPLWGVILVGLADLALIMLSRFRGD